MYNQACNLSVTYTLLPLLDCKMKHTDDVCVTVIWTPAITTLDVILIQKYTPFEYAIAHCSIRWHFFFYICNLSVHDMTFGNQYTSCRKAHVKFCCHFTPSSHDIVFYRTLARIKSVVHSTGGSSHQSHAKWVGWRSIKLWNLVWANWRRRRYFSCKRSTPRWVTSKQSRLWWRKMPKNYPK